ncbi:heterokaryon incompatibility protein-domain-containing protein [Tricladium varicosporioides]|nr:heterokaryon incompatibility protein-domain-containing protein [Hymenoscyphus varicosporioides]
MSSRTARPARFTVLCEWLRQCDESHSCNQESVETGTFLPTRLIFVGTTQDPNSLRLVLGTEIDGGKYIALSHQWGNPSDDEKEEFCTTQDNINHRLSGFSIFDLPKTFQDAVTATRELHVPYLWIDSLCIIQLGDDKKDWKFESERMQKVYSNAYFTIAATSARDMKDGFLDRNAWLNHLYIQDISGRRFYICVGTDDFEKDVEAAELNKRAWVVQERLLSRRIVHFSAKQTYWECGEGIYCGNLTRMQGSRKGNFFMHDSNFPNKLFRSGFYTTLEFIQALFVDYSQRNLTQKTDRAVAISGLQSRIADTLQTKSRYGVLQKYLHRNLLWHAPDNKKLERIPYPGRDVPSWSWMAYTGSVQFAKIPFGRVKWKNNLCFDEEHELALIAEVRKFQNYETKLFERHCVIVGSGGVERGRIQYDTEIVDLCQLRCVILGSYKAAKYRWSAEQYCILVVRQTAVDGEYERIGSGSIHRDYVVRGDVLRGVRIV